MRVPRSISILAGTCYHLIWQAHNRSFLFDSKEDKLLYLQSVLSDVKNKVKNNEVMVHGFCIMSNHVHRIGKLLSTSQSLSGHMRRSHSRFAQTFNNRHNRSGAVGNSRPTTIPIENHAGEMRVLFYILTNPVRAGIIKDPTHIGYRLFSCCRFYAYGETTEFTKMLTLPQWYLDLGKTPSKRQAKFRSLLNKYLIECGFIRDPKLSESFCIGSKAFTEEMMKRKREYYQVKAKGVTESSGYT